MYSLGMSECRRAQCFRCSGCGDTRKSCWDGEFDAFWESSHPNLPRFPWNLAWYLVVDMCQGYTAQLTSNWTCCCASIGCWIQKWPLYSSLSGLEWTLWLLHWWQETHIRYISTRNIHKGVVGGQLNDWGLFLRTLTSCRGFWDMYCQYYFLWHSKLLTSGFPELMGI
jgi:hypothetical protein